MDLNALNILAGLVAVSLFGVASIKMKIVDLSGLAAGFIVGFFIFIVGIWKWFTIILAFHLITGVFTKYKYEPKKMRGGN